MSSPYKLDAKLALTARGVAWHVLERVERDRAFAELALHAALRDSDLERRDRALATELCYGTLRLRGRLDAALAQSLNRPWATQRSAQISPSSGFAPGSSMMPRMISLIVVPQPTFRITSVAWSNGHRSE